MLMTWCDLRDCARWIVNRRHRTLREFTSLGAVFICVTEEINNCILFIWGFVALFVILIAIFANRLLFRWFSCVYFKFDCYNFFCFVFFYSFGRLTLESHILVIIQVVYLVLVCILMFDISILLKPSSPLLDLLQIFIIALRIFNVKLDPLNLLVCLQCLFLSRLQWPLTSCNHLLQTFIFFLRNLGFWWTLMSYFGR